MTDASNFRTRASCFAADKDGAVVRLSLPEDSANILARKQQHYLSLKQDLFEAISLTEEQAAGGAEAN